MRDDRQRLAERIGTTKSHLYHAARTGQLVRDRWQVTLTDKGLDVTDTEKTDDAEIIAGGIEPGVYPDMSNEDYHAGPGISSTQIKDVDDGAPIKHAMSKDPTADMILGTHAHTCILEPERWEAQKSIEPPDGSGNEHKASIPVATAMIERGITYAEAAECPDVQSAVVEVMPSRWNRDTALGKVSEALVEFYCEHGPDYEPLDSDTIEQVEHMRDAVRDCPAVDTAWIDDSRRELSVFWHEETTSGTILCKARVDMLSGSHLVDLKTTRDASPTAFSRSLYTFGYHVSLDYYSHGLVMAGVQPVDQHTIVAVEKSDPYLCAVYGMDAEDLAQGREVWRAGLELIAAYLTTDGADGGYSEQRETLRLPGWAKSKTEDKVRRLQERTEQIKKHADNPFK